MQSRRFTASFSGVRRAAGFTSRKLGFTLIELLVVIAIIAILAAILFPVFAQARDKARQTACLSNLKQIGTATGMYNQDYDECFPAFKYSNGPYYAAMPDGSMYKGKVFWQLLYYPYIKSQQVFVCPNDQNSTKGLSPNPANPSGTYDYNNPIPTSYLDNGSMFDATVAIYLAQVQFPSNTYLIADGNHGDLLGFYSGDGASTTTPAQNIYVPYSINLMRISSDCSDLVVSGSNASLKAGADPNKCMRHNGGSNITYCDGHAKWLPYTQIYGTRANPVRTTD